MLYEAIIAALLIGWIFGGKITRLADARINHTWLLAITGITCIFRFINFYHPIVSGGTIYCCSTRALEFGPIMALTILNRHIPGAKLMFLGLLLNVLPMLLNGGEMPVSVSGVKLISGGVNSSELLNGDLRHIAINAHTKLPLLADIIPINTRYMLRGVYSIGDFVTSFGGMLAIISIMRDKKVDAAKVEVVSAINSGDV